MGWFATATSTLKRVAQTDGPQTLRHFRISSRRSETCDPDQPPLASSALTGPPTMRGKMEARPLAVALLLSLLVLGSLGASGADSTSSSDPETNGQSTSVASASRSDSSGVAHAHTTGGAMSIPPTVVTTFAVIGGVVVALLGAGVIAAIVLSIFGIRACYVLGTCSDPYGFMASTPYEMPYPAYASIPYPASAYHAKSSDTNGNELPQYDAYSQVSYPTGYQKRSLEYVGPILKAIGSAYGQHYGQHYGQQYYGQQNTQQIPGTPRKSSELTASTEGETNHNLNK